MYFISRVKKLCCTAQDDIAEVVYFVVCSQTLTKIKPMYRHFFFQLKYHWIQNISILIYSVNNIEYFYLPKKCFPRKINTKNEIVVNC